jgi:hypothetical protein
MLGVHPVLKHCRTVTMQSPVAVSQRSSVHASPSSQSGSAVHPLGIVTVVVVVLVVEKYVNSTVVAVQTVVVVVGAPAWAGPTKRAGTMATKAQASRRTMRGP